MASARMERVLEQSDLAFKHDRPRSSKSRAPSLPAASADDQCSMSNRVDDVAEGPVEGAALQNDSRPASDTSLGKH